MIPVSHHLNARRGPDFQVNDVDVANPFPANRAILLFTFISQSTGNHCSVREEPWRIIHESLTSHADIEIQKLGYYALRVIFFGSAEVDAISEVHCEEEMQDHTEEALEHPSQSWNQV